MRHLALLIAYSFVTMTTAAQGGKREVLWSADEGEKEIARVAADAGMLTANAVETMVREARLALRALNERVRLG